MRYFVWSPGDILSLRLCKQFIYTLKQHFRRHVHTANDVNKTFPSIRQTRLIRQHYCLFTYFCPWSMVVNIILQAFRVLLTRCQTGRFATTTYTWGQTRLALTFGSNNFYLLGTNVEWSLCRSFVRNRTSQSSVSVSLRAVALFNTC